MPVTMRLAASVTHLARAVSPTRVVRHRLTSSIMTNGVGVGIVDAHVHVWPSANEHDYPSNQVPPCPGSYTDLIGAMDAHGVRGAMIVQPINLGFDHAYVREAMEAHPGRFVGMCLANPAAGERGVADLKALLAPNGPFRGVRFNPGLWPEGERMDGEVGRAMFRVCAEAEPPAVVGFMCFHGLHLHLDQIRALCRAEPSVPVLMDHFGFCKGVDDPNFAELLRLGRDFPQVRVKASAHFRVRTSDDSTAEQLKALLEVYGPSRIIWGSDYPFVTMEDGGYAGAVNVLMDQVGGDEELLAELRGGNFAKLFPGAIERA